MEAVSEKKKLMIQKYPGMCERGLSPFFAAFYSLRKPFLQNEQTENVSVSVRDWYFNNNTAGILKGGTKSPTKNRNSTHYSYSTS